MNNTIVVQFEISWASSQNNYFLDEKDAFAEGFESLHIKLAFALTYIWTIICGLLLLFVIWFERSGQAGSFRTMLNQLASFIMEQVDINMNRWQTSQKSI